MVGSLADEVVIVSSRLLLGGVNETATRTVNTTEVLKDSLRLYGVILVLGFSIYCVLRKKIPRVFAVRQWAPGCRTPLADDQFGYLSWIWKVYSIPTEQLLETISFDALCFLRLMNMGFRLACVGAFNSVWLFPVYATANDKTSSDEEDDKVEKVAINVLRGGSPRFVATVLAAYVFFFYTMYTILKEFRWFITNRHRWLRKFTARNYTIYVRSIPKELRSDRLLLDHFQKLYGADRVLEAHVCVHLGKLESLVAKRKSCVENLEHALARLAVSGKRPRQVLLLQAVGNAVSQHNLSDTSETEVDTIEHYSEELDKLNAQISEQIDKIEKKQRPKLLQRSGGERSLNTVPDLGSDSHMDAKALMLSECDEDDALDDSFDSNSPSIKQNSSQDSVKSDDDDEEEEVEPGDMNTSNALSRSKGRRAVSLGSVKDVVSTTSGLIKEGIAHGLASDSATAAKDAGSALTKKAIKNAKKRVSQAKGTAIAVKDVAASILSQQEDGTADDAGFVTFTSLAAVHGALQMSQHPDPFVMETHLCPGSSRFIFWNNVGKDKEVLQTGRLIAVGMASALCLFWTLIVAFIVNLTNVDHLKGEFPALESTLEKYPAISRLLAVVSPLLLLIFNSGLLPIILKAVSRFEFPASDSMLEAAAFWKMAAFTVIQTFFVSLVSGSIVQEIVEILDRPAQFVELLARALPEQSGYFMQLLIVSTCVGANLELFRVVPLFQAAVRAHIGRHLTEKERNQCAGPMKPLSVVDKIYFSRIQSRFLLYFMVLFVYSTISPLINVFSVFFFLFLGTIYRHQFIFNYPNKPDSGGEIWLHFVRVLLACMMIAQLTIVGFLALKQAHIALPFMIPLIVISSLFIAYLHQRHFQVGEFLPALFCLSQDLANAEDGVDYSVFADEYKNPALRERFLDADWDSGKSEYRRRPYVQGQITRETADSQA